eukprot:407126-Pelagomonas_calceolata.AAC.1
MEGLGEAVLERKERERKGKDSACLYRYELRVKQLWAVVVVSQVSQAGSMPAKKGSSRSFFPACLTSDGWALDQEHILE